MRSRLPEPFGCGARPSALDSGAPPGKASFRGNAGDARPEAERLKSDRIQNVIYYTYLLVIARKIFFFIDQEPTKVQTAPFSV